MARRAPSHGTFVSRGRTDHTSGRVGRSQESLTRPTKDGDVGDVARRVAVLFPSRWSPRPCSGLCPLPTIREESASEDEDERESMGSRAQGYQTDVLLDTPSYGPGRVTTDPSIQDMGNASRQLGSADDVMFVGAGACASGTGDALDVFIGLSPVDGSQECPKMVIGHGATSSLTDLVDEAMCIVSLHGAEDEASVNEEMPSVGRCASSTQTYATYETPRPFQKERNFPNESQRSPTHYHRSKTRWCGKKNWTICFVRYENPRTRASQVLKRTRPALYTRTCR